MKRLLAFLRVFERALPPLARSHFREWRMVHLLAHEPPYVDRDGRDVTDKRAAEIQFHFEDERLAIKSRSLIRKAERWQLPVPRRPRPGVEGVDDKCWEQGDSGFFRLSPIGFKKVRARIRNERKERREAWQSWTPLVAALAGLAAAVAGVLTVLSTG